ncbi:CusA/CzcA family heavy metal efflux RND transporter [Scytonema hofmannii FACHB-248]|uniref:CusA/CzcA family heavy metal efflux RND transporter n=1 Tax=Scytonema hofmannii FACHB-248 TaxID=1842502 RepID=A0ABR8GS49_9CYAN|nr:MULTISPECIES: efflux RND transporter permease subunit [Nostocales]MBD2605736.1 CusA/CzcA family heavy metal efflux RND transporter [Scytonema hofmannii FACHB-248]
MLGNIVKWVINRRWLVVLATIIVSFWTFYVIPQMPLDVLPAFAPPQVEIQAEAPGLAPEEVESLVTLPIESAINGTPGVTAVRSSSAAGISAVRVIFNSSTDIYQARQLVTERLQQAVSKLPPGVETPQISPTTSPVGLVVQYAFTVEDEKNSSNSTPEEQATSPTPNSLMEARRIVDWQVTNRLLAVPGVSQILSFGGDERQFQVLVDPVKLAAFNITLDQVTQATQKANVNAPGGFLITPDTEQLIRGIGRIESIEDLKKSSIIARNGVPVRLQDVADVQIGAALKRGDGSFNGKPAIIVMVNKQPIVDTPTVTRAVEKAMAEIKAGLPKNIKVTTTFRQDSYIESSVDNVRSSLIQGSIIAAIILIPFLMNWRILAVCLLDFFLTLLFGMLALSWLGIGLNTMTLGGLAVAIGTAIDDAIVYGENTYRRLRENKTSDDPLSPLEIIFEGSQEVRDSLVGATIIGIIVFSPIFTLPGIEGRIFTPMGISYLVVVVISSLESLLVSPALCAILLPNTKVTKREPWLARFCKGIYSSCLNFSMRNSFLIMGIATVLTVASIVIIPSFGRAFLPEFQEQTMVNTLISYPTVSLESSTKAGHVIEEALKNDRRFKFIQTRSGRASGDSEAAGVNVAHLDIELTDEGMRNREKTLGVIRAAFEKIPGAAANIGGFLSHRMDEVLSGVRSSIAVKIFGSDLAELRKIGQQVEQQMATVNGVIDLQLEPQLPVPQIQIKFDRDAASRYGHTVGDLANTIETALNGKVVSQVLENQQSFDLIVWLKPEARQNLETIRNLLIDTPNGQKVPLGNVASIVDGTGPNTINRENVSRLIVVSANAKGRDLRSIVTDIESKVKSNIQVPAGYFIQYAGQFEAEERATQNILVFSAIAFIAITVLMYLSVKSIPSTAMIMINLPIALVGGVIAVALTGGVISVASLVGFVSLFGVATRNGLLLVDNYNSKYAEGMPLKEVIVKGSMERLNAILMTALTSALGLAPMVIQGGPGQELLQPLSVVVFGGLFTSTAITLVVLPALYAKFGKFLFPKKVEEAKEGQFLMHM